MSMGFLEGLTSALGDEDTDIGGIYSTRLTAAVAEGVTVFPVESTLDWPISGKLAVGGVVYLYSGTTSTSFTGIQHENNGTLVAGAYRLHNDASEVLDITHSRNALDRVRQAMLVGYATEEDLSVLGRNLGVLRLPFVNDDERYRKIIKALAYNPRGTTYGLELALDGLVDPGNYEIFEDLLQFPCTVFIRLKGAATTDDVSAGKAFLNSGIHRPALDTVTVDLPAGTVVQKVQSVRFKDEDFVTPCNVAKPSAHSIVEYTGGPTTPVWAFVGGAESDVTVNPLGYCSFNDSGAGTTTGYQRHQRIVQPSRAAWSLTFSVDSAGTMSALSTSGNQWRACVRDSAQAIAWGCIEASSTTFQVGFIDITTGAFIAGAAAILQKDTFYTVVVQKDGQKDLQLFVDGNLVQTVPWASFPAATDSFIADFGCFSTSLAGMRANVAEVGMFVTTLRDYWADRLSVGVLVNPNRLNTGLMGALLAAPLGKRVTLSDTLTMNSQGGLNQGRYVVKSVLGYVDLELEDTPKTGANTDSGYPLRVTVTGLESAKAFRYPDHLGRKLVISGSALGNDGTYIIDKILDSDTLVDMGSWLSHQPEWSNVCEVVAASFVSEPSLTWQLDPDFVAESGVAWELSDAGIISGIVLTLPQELPLGLPLANCILTVRYTDVLSGQVLLDSSVSNGPIDIVPHYDYYPFYVADPLGYVRSYLDDLTAAGVIPDFRLV